jgi:hypothetical protein
MTNLSAQLAAAQSLRRLRVQISSVADDLENDPLWWVSPYFGAGADCGPTIFPSRQCLDISNYLHLGSFLLRCECERELLDSEGLFVLNDRLPALFASSAASAGASVHHGNDDQLAFVLIDCEGVCSGLASFPS